MFDLPTFLSNSFSISHSSLYGLYIVEQLSPVLTLIILHDGRQCCDSQWLLFQFAVSQGPHMLLQCIAVAVRFLLTALKEAAGNGFFWLADLHHN
jgi:hypothetical protein